MGVPMTTRERQVFTLPTWLSFLFCRFYVFGTDAFLFCVLRTCHAPRQLPCQLLGHKMQDQGCQIPLLHSVQPSQAMMAAACGHNSCLPVHVSDQITSRWREKSHKQRTQ